MKDKTKQSVLELLRPIGLGLGIGFTLSSLAAKPYIYAVGYGVAGAFSFLMCLLATLQIHLRKKL